MSVRARVLFEKKTVGWYLPSFMNVEYIKNVSDIKVLCDPGFYLLDPIRLRLSKMEKKKEIKRKMPWELGG